MGSYWGFVKPQGMGSLQQALDIGRCFLKGKLAFCSSLWNALRYTLFEATYLGRIFLMGVVKDLTTRVFWGGPPYSQQYISDQIQMIDPCEEKMWNHKKWAVGAGEMAQWLQAPAVQVWGPDCGSPVPCKLMGMALHVCNSRAGCGGIGTGELLKSASLAEKQWTPSSVTDPVSRDWGEKYQTSLLRKNTSTSPFTHMHLVYICGGHIHNILKWGCERRLGSHSCPTGWSMLPTPQPSREQTLVFALDPLILSEQV